MNKYPLLILVVCLSCTSCSPISKVILKSMGVFKKTNKPIALANASKQLSFLPMHHIGVPEYYADTKRIVDSLHSKGYIVFYEAVALKPETDSIHKDLLVRKYRKLVGLLGTSDGYIDTLNGTINGRKLTFAKQLRNQPLGPAIGLDSSIDLNVDVKINDLIGAYEEKFGSIILNECDKTTPFKAKYTCEKIRGKEEKKFFFQDYRNEYLAGQIIQSSANKIAIMYGANHFDGLFKILQSRDSTWKKR